MRDWPKVPPPVCRVRSRVMAHWLDQLHWICVTARSTMATGLPDEADITELGFRVSRLRVSLRIKRGEVRQLLVPEAPEIPSSSPNPQPLALRASSPAECLSPVEPQRHFRSRLSSTSSVASSIDSGIVVARSRANSSTSTSSNRPGSILRKIARAAIPVGTENAGFEFEGFYHTAVSRTSSMTSSVHSSVSRTPSTSSSTPSTSSSSPTKFPVTNPRVRSVSLSSSHARSRICSDDSSDYADLYDTIEELTDPFDEDEEEETPPPLPPRKARLRAPALPPYPSTALRMVNNITATILC